MAIEGQELGEGPGRLADDPPGSDAAPDKDAGDEYRRPLRGRQCRHRGAGHRGRGTGAVGWGHGVTANEAIPLGHKVALEPIPSSALIVRFGVPVGIATADIRPGSLVHVHNVKSQYLDNVEDHYE